MKKIIVANWKMYGSRVFCRAYLQDIRIFLNERVRLIVCPPFPYLSEFAGAPFNLGAQNCHAAPEGPCTGEVSAAMLYDLGCQYVILGHSERRQNGEASIDVAQKVKAATKAGLIAIVCVGETHEQRLNGQTEAVVLQQLSDSLDTASIIAYEPIWAIGTGLTPQLQDISRVHQLIRHRFPGKLVLYGGSVKPDNAREILHMPEVDGVLVGGASLDVAGFGRIIQEGGT